MLLEILAWLVIGGLAGWLASIITGTNARVSGFTNVIVGIVGAFIGGLLLRLFGGGGTDIGFNLPSLLTAILGAVVLLFVYKALRSKSV